MRITKYLLPCAIGLAATATFAQTTSTAPALQQAFEKARQVDPLYQAGLSEYDGTLLQARAAGLAYLPYLEVSSAQQAAEGGGRRNSFAVVQPILSADRIASLREKEPLTRLAELQLMQREIDLAKRLFAAFSEVVMARESLQMNKARLTALEQQVTASGRLLTLNQGTITDVRDAEVKLLQARGEELRMRSRLQVAEKQYASIVGEAPPLTTLAFSKSKAESLGKLANGVNTRIGDAAMLADRTPEVEAAQTQRELADIDAFRSRSAWMPQISLVHNRSRLEGQDNNFTGLSLSLPLSAGNYASMQSAGAKAAQFAHEAQDVQRKALLEIERLKSTVEFGASEVAMQQSAVEAAELSVEANDKSFKGGVRSMQDVLTSIEVLYTVKADRVKSLLSLADGMLNLRMMEGVKAAESLTEVESTLLR